MKTRGERIREWTSEQTALSLGLLLVGAGGVAVFFVGTILLVWLNGPTPWESLLETVLSAAQGTVLNLALGLGAAAAIAGFASYRRMPTKAAREAAVSGAALGVQAVLLVGVFYAFRKGENVALTVRQNFNFELLGEFGDAFVNGAKNTVFLAAVGEALGIALGLVLALLILSERVVVRAPARAYINFFRGTPLVWQLAFGYFGLKLGMRIPISTYQTAALVLGLNAGAYSAEIFRSGIQSIERGQREAARSLGMSYMQSMRYVILPQAFRRVIPPLTNEFIILIKDTSLVFVLGLTLEGRELFAVARDAYAERFNATMYIGAVIGYLAITLPLIRAVTMLENKLRAGYR
ncbi:MAG TPA: amino acid ABC transporter permease [Actinomycetota bacterium]|nr:amino acid ABC transporter permease [Actinomycetota bacterium]